MDEPNAMQQRILDAARKLFAEKGFKATTTRMLAAGAGINEVTLFRNFGTKEAILNQLIDRSFVLTEASPLDKILTRKVDNAAQLENLLVDFGVIFYENHLMANRELVFINFFEAGTRPESRNSFSAAIRSLIEDLVTRLREIDRTGAVALDPDQDCFVCSLLYIQSLIGTFLLVHRMELSIVPYPVPELCRREVRLLLGGLLA